MKIPDITRDPPRDPELAGWLRAMDDDRESQSFEPMRAMLRERAQLSLARLRRRMNWWDYAAAWARPAMPAAAAAGLALALVVGNLPVPSAASDDFAAGFPSMEEVLAVTMSDPEYDLVLANGAGADALLRMAVEDR